MFIPTLDLEPVRHSIRRMNSETWLEKATRLQREVTRDGTDSRDDEVAARQRIKLALWLRREFSEERDAPNVIPFAVGAQE